MQNHYNLVYREEEREMIPQCIDQGVAVSRGARSRAACRRQPHAATGERLHHPRRHRPVQDSSTRRRSTSTSSTASAEVAAERGVSPAQVALAWLLHRPGVTAPIVGATKTAHLEDALAAEQLALSEGRDRPARGAYVPHAHLRSLEASRLSCPGGGV